MNKNLFRATMALHGETYNDIAKILGIATNTVSDKINEKIRISGNKSEFTQAEMFKLKNHWNLSNDEFMQIFFTEIVS